MDADYFKATLRLEIAWKYGNDQEALLNAFGKLIYKGKVIGRLELDTNTIEFNIKPSDPSTQINREGTANLSFIIELDPKITNLINNTRKTEPRGDVILKAEITLVYLVNHIQISFINEYKADHWFFPLNQTNIIKKSIGADSDDVSFLLYAYPRSRYGQNRTNLRLLSADDNWAYIAVKHITKVLDITIKASDWVHDFLPGLGIGEYEVIEIPKLKMDDVYDVFKQSLEYLETAQKELYAIHTGPAQSALRNSIKAFNEALIKMGYKTKNSKGNYIADYKKVFNDNKNIAALADSLQNKLYGTSSRSSDPTSPHADGYSIEGYEVESMIFMAYSLYKMVFQKLKEGADAGGNLE